MLIGSRLVENANVCQTYQTKPRWFSVCLVPKLLLTPMKIGNFGPKYAFVVILGQILAFLAHLIPCLAKNNVNKVPSWFFVTRVPKLLLTPMKIGNFGLKYAFVVILGQILAFLTHLIPCPAINNVNKVPRTRCQI